MEWLISFFVHFHTNMASLTTVNKWQSSLKCKLDILEIVDGKVRKMKCIVCSQFSDKIKGMKGFSQAWVDGTESIKKDSLDKHIKGEPHKHAKDLSLKVSLGAKSYNKEIVSKTPIGKGLTKMQEEDEKVISFCHNFD
eukprot:TCONS_00011226-protein